MYLGTYGIDEYLPIPAVTHRFSTGAAYAPTAITYSIYEEGSTTGIAEDTDMTPASPFDSVTGLYYARVQLTSAAGYEVNKTYVVVVKATVDSVAAIEAHVFQIRPLQTGDSYAIVNSGTYGNAALKTLIDIVDNFIDTEVAAILADTNELQTDLVNGGRLDLLIDSIITHLTDLKGATFNSATDSNEAIRNRGDAAWVTATGFSTFNPATDTVARVTLVDTTTTNTDMVAAAPSAASIADAVLDEAMAGHVAAGSLGKAVADVLEDTATTLPAAIDAVDNFVDTEIATLDGKLDDLLEALVYKMVITEADGATELFDASNTSKGSIAAAFVSDSGYTTRKKLVL